MIAGRRTILARMGGLENFISGWLYGIDWTYPCSVSMNCGGLVKYWWHAWLLAGSVLAPLGSTLAESPDSSLEVKGLHDSSRRRPAQPGSDPTRRSRRGIEAASPPRSVLRQRTEPKEIRVAMPGCALHGAHHLRHTLRGLKNRSQLMSLEVWGDTKTYHPGQKVMFFFRSPRPSYVTLFWLGPRSDVVIPIANVKIPGHRDVKVDSGGIIVPPLGREEWVAINTLEPVYFPCHVGQRAVVKALERTLRLPHGVGRWQVHSTR